MFKTTVQRLHDAELEAREDVIQCALGIGFICKYCHKVAPLFPFGKRDVISLDEPIERLCRPCRRFIFNHEERKRKNNEYA